MGTNPGAAVKKAFDLFVKGKTVAEATKKAGIDQSTLRRYQPYIDHVAARKANNG